MAQHEVERDGQRDLRFEGELLAEVSDREHSGPKSNRWTEVRIYRTGGGRYVVATTNRTQWQGEWDKHDATVCETLGEVMDALTDDQGVLGRAEKEALQAACEIDETLRELEYEDV